MKATLQNANSVLGPELVTVFQETCGNDENALKQMINEAIRALSIMKREGGWRNYNIADELN